MLRRSLASVLMIVLLAPPPIWAAEPDAAPDPLTALIAADPAVAKAQAEYDAEVAKAEAVCRAARRKAAEARLRFVKSRVEYHTKEGDFDRATVAKAAQVQLETSGVDVVRPRPTDVVKFGGHEYAVVGQMVSWHEAKATCEQMGGHLVTIESSGEAIFVQNLVNRPGLWWCFVGCSDEHIEGDWRWINGKPLQRGLADIHDKTSWEHHLAVSHSEGWGDIPAGWRTHFVCEWD